MKTSGRSEAAALLPEDESLLRSIEVAVREARGGVEPRGRPDLPDKLRSLALRLFVEHGFDDVTVSDIAAAADVTTRTFFRHFGSKEAVVGDIFESLNRQLIAIIEALPADLSPRDAISAMVREWAWKYRQVGPVLNQILGRSPSIAGVMIGRTPFWSEQIQRTLVATRPDLNPVMAQFWAFAILELMRVTLLEEAKTDHEYGERLEENLLHFAAFCASVAGLGDAVQGNQLTPKTEGVTM